MRIVNVHEAFVIAKAGHPMVKVMSLDAPVGTEIRRTGFLAGEITVPEDFDRMGASEIEDLFGETS